MLQHTRAVVNVNGFTKFRAQRPFRCSRSTIAPASSFLTEPQKRSVPETCGLPMRIEGKTDFEVIVEHSARATFNDHVTIVFAYKDYPFQRRAADVTLRLPEASRTAAGPSIGTR